MEIFIYKEKEMYKYDKDYILDIGNDKKLFIYINESKKDSFTMNIWYNEDINSDILIKLSDFLINIIPEDKRNILYSKKALSNGFIYGLTKDGISDEVFQLYINEIKKGEYFGYYMYNLKIKLFLRFLSFQQLQTLFRSIQKEDKESFAKAIYYIINRNELQEYKLDINEIVSLFSENKEDVLIMIDGFSSAVLNLYKMLQLKYKNDLDVIRQFLSKGINNNFNAIKDDIGEDKLFQICKPSMFSSLKLPNNFEKISKENRVLIYNHYPQYFSGLNSENTAVYDIDKIEMDSYYN